MRPLKVLFLATRDWYNPATTGGDNTMWENARYLASVGHSVTFVAAGYRGAAAREKIEGIDVVRLGGIHSLWLRTFLYYLAQGRGRYDVVVAEGFGGSRIPRLAPLYVRAPLITEWHQIHRDLFEAQYPWVMRGPLNLLERVSVWVNRNSAVRAGTSDWRDAFVRAGFRSDRVFVLPVSIRDDWLAEAKPRLVGEPNILWLGKIRRYKRPDHAIQAMKVIVGRFPDARLTIAGHHDDANYEKQMQSLAARSGLGDHVAFRFDISEAEKRDLMAKTRVLVLPSAVEGFGIVVLEANACGVPVVASSRVPRGAVEDGLNGLRYAYGNVGALAEAVCRTLGDDALYRRLSEQSRAFAENFAWSRIGAEFTRVVESAAAAPAPDPAVTRKDHAAKVS